jgi:hypothetical protein
MYLNKHRKINQESIKHGTDSRLNRHVVFYGYQVQLETLGNIKHQVHHSFSADLLLTLTSYVI